MKNALFSEKQKIYSHLCGTITVMKEHMEVIPVGGWILLAVVLVIGLAMAAISNYMFHYLFYKPKRNKETRNLELDTPYYRAVREGLALMEQAECEDVYITSRDGLKLHAYYYPAPEENGKFMLGIHGYHAYARREYAPYFAFYRSLGYGILLPDNRAHGPSEGKYIGFGVLDRLDCVDWAKYLVERFGANIQIQLHGVSMGSATVMAASGEDDLPSQVRGIVADCGYTSAWDVLSYQLPHTAHLPVHPFLEQCESVCKMRAGFDFHEHSPIEQVRKTNVPILFVHGGKDEKVPPHMARELYEACGSLKRLLEIPEAAHAESIALEPELYCNTIREFFRI